MRIQIFNEKISTAYILISVEGLRQLPVITRNPLRRDVNTIPPIRHEP